MRFRCRRCSSPGRHFEFEDLIQCPRCGATGEAQVFQLADVHFIVLGSGPIWSDSWGRQHVACMPERDALALYVGDDFAASDQPQAVTCPSCKTTPAYVEMVRALFPQMLIDEQRREARGLNWKRRG